LFGFAFVGGETCDGDERLVNRGWKQKQTNKQTNLSVQQGSEGIWGHNKAQNNQLHNHSKSDTFILFCFTACFSPLALLFFFFEIFGHVFSDVLLRGFTPLPTIAIKTSYEEANENAGSVMKSFGLHCWWGNIV
jgi:hypothetical protein